MSQPDNSDLGDLEKSSMPTSKVMQAAGQLRPQEGDKEAALDLLRKKLVGCGLGITKSQIFLAIFALFHTTVFAHGFFHYYSEDEFVTAMARFGVAFPIASAAGLVLHIDLAILMFPVCRALMSVIRRRLLNNIIDLDHVVSLHKLASLSIVFFACIHTIAYCCSFARQAIQNGTGLRGFLALNITTGPGLSGHLMLLVLNVIAVTSLKGFRQARSKLFWSTHHLFILFLVLWTIHGSFCMIKTDTTSSCASMGAFWQYFLCGGATYLGERIMRAWYGRHGTPISKVIQHPGKVVEIQLKKRKTKAKVGQYIYFCSPEVSISQDLLLHLSSAPEEDYMSVHIRCINRFAQEMAASIGCDFEKLDDSTVIGIDEKAKPVDFNPVIRKLLPPTFIDGPYGGLSKDIFQFEVAILVAMGTEVAPFASILKSIWYRMSGSSQESRLRKVYFFWSCDRQNFAACEWFRSLLRAIEAQDMDNNIEIYTYLLPKIGLADGTVNTAEDVDIPQEKLNCLRVPTKLGQPDWGDVFHAVHGAHAPTKVAYVTHSLDFKNLKCSVMF